MSLLCSKPSNGSHLIPSKTKVLFNGPAPRHLSDFFSYYFPTSLESAAAVPSAWNAVLPNIHTAHALIPYKSLLNYSLLPQHKIVISKYYFPLKQHQGSLEKWLTASLKQEVHAMRLEYFVTPESEDTIENY